MSDDRYAIKAKFEATCPPHDLKRWLDSADGIAGWWSDTVTGDASSTGDGFSVRFPTSPVVFELEVTEMRDDIVEWKVPESPPWWKGTVIRFETSPAEGGGSTLLFTHAGFSEDDPIIPVITPAWVRFLDNLVRVAETKTPAPAVVN